MQQRPSQGLAEVFAGFGAEALTPERIESVLADFRTWLQQAADQAATTPPSPDDSHAEHAKPIDLHTLIGQFLALRHEVHLQTRAARTQQEQNAQTLEQFSQALDALRQSSPEARQFEEAPDNERLRPLLKTLLDVEDALGLARREVQRAREGLLPMLDEFATALAVPSEPAAPPSGTAAPAPRSLWARLFGAVPKPPVSAPAAQGAMVSSERQRHVLHEAQRLRAWIDSLVTGYTMSLQRLERALRQSGLEPIPCIDQPFDPEKMEAVDAATDTGLPAGQVVEEIRRGYLWRGRVFRYALVRVAKS
jgi:molecular chaperone GrpE